MTEPHDQQPQFEALTAREALLEVRRRAAEVHLDVEVTSFACQIDRVALEGLQRTAPINFALSDQLADRLAESHRVLNMVIDYLYGRLPDGDSTLESKVKEALALPPDLETMVERRIGR